MAQRIVVTLTDDLDGSEADESVQFAIDGVTYEIDLSAGNAEELREALSKYVLAARRTGGRKKQGSPIPTPRQGHTGPTASPTTNTSLTASPRTVRAWAASNGFKVSDRGRIPQEVMIRFEESQPA